jgi:hypothetical protein
MNADLAGPAVDAPDSTVESREREVCKCAILR